MTQDFLDDFTTVLQRERRGFIICVAGLNSDGERVAKMAVDLEPWPSPPGQSRQFDALQMIAIAMSVNGHEKFRVLNDDRAANAAAALRTLHRLANEGDREISDEAEAMYQQAMKVLTS